MKKNTLTCRALEARSRMVACLVDTANFIRPKLCMSDVGTKNGKVRKKGVQAVKS